MPANNTLFLVDGSSLAFRSFYALITSGMRNSVGTPTWAVYGFFSSLFDMIEKYQPHSLAVCFDLAEPTFRHEEYEDYKANRQEMPDDLSSQWPLLKEGIDAFAIPLYELAGFEADDVIGTIATRAATEKDMDVIILTGDQDAFQLLSDRIKVLMPSRDGLKTYGRQEVFDKLGVWPEQVIDYKGLCGDSSDNIKGVKGIGPKTAVQLLSQFHDIPGIYEHLDEIKSASTRNKLSEGRQSAFSSRELATIRLDVPINFDFDQCQLSCPNPAPAIDFLQKLDLKNFLRKLPKILANFNEGVEPKIDAALIASRAKTATKAETGQSEVAGTPSSPVQLLLREPDDAATGSDAGASTPGIDAACGVQGPATVADDRAIIVSSESKLETVIDQLTGCGWFSLDLRTTSANPFEAELVGIGLAWGQGLSPAAGGRLSLSDRESEGLSCAYIPVGRKGEVATPTETVMEKLKPLLEDQGIAKIVFDAKAKTNILFQFGIRPSKFSFDPLLASYIVNPDQNHQLSHQAKTLVGHEMGELSLRSEDKKPPPLDLLPNSHVGPMSQEQALVLVELTRHYLGSLDFDQQELLWSMDLPVASVIASMEQAGVKIDAGYFQELDSMLGTELARLESEIFALAGHSFNVNSPVQLQKVLFEELELPAKVRTKTGYSTDASVLEDLLDAHPIIEKIGDYRQVSKLISTYVEALPKQISPRDGRLHTDFNMTATATGRLSSSNPNLQNIPIRTEWGRSIRRGFVPGAPDGYIVTADYSQIELRFLAHMSGDENLIEAFRAGEDIHSRTARLIFDLKQGEVTPEQRAVGKTLNFALIYQQGAFSTGKALHISTREAQEFIDKYFRSYPKVRSFMDRVIEEARSTGYVHTLWGRRRYFSHLNDRNDNVRRADERAAFNAPLQGSAADLIKLAMIELDSELKRRKMKSRLILQVHDELVLDVPPGEVDQAKEVVREAMGMGQPLSVPLQVDVGAGRNWMDAK